MIKIAKEILTVICLFILTSCSYSAKNNSKVEYSPLEYRSAGEQLDDFLIKERVSAALKKSIPTSYSDIKITVLQGCVKYIGELSSSEDMIKAIDAAWSVAGVKEVANYIEIDNSSSGFDVTQYSQDSWITAAIKIKTLLNKDIKFNNFTVVTNKNVVYIFGLARTKEEMDDIASIASKVQNVKKVIVNVKLTD